MNVKLLFTGCLMVSCVRTGSSSFFFETVERCVTVRVLVIFVSKP